MKIQYILIRRSKSDAKSIRIQSEVKKMLEEAGFEVGNKSICFSKECVENVSYTMSYEDNNILYLTIKTESSGIIATKLLDEFNMKLLKGSHRSKFNIINAYSDSSMWCCRKLMPLLGKFERLLREFIYLNLTKVYGNEWIKVLDENHRHRIDEISKGSVSKIGEYIEESLEWLEFKEIENFLFTPCIYEDVDQVLTNILKDDSLTREGILEELKKLEKVSLWDREFQSFSEVDDLQIQFEDIRDIRNTVMHNKNISYEYFEWAEKNILNINRQLRQALNRIESDLYRNPKSKKPIIFDLSGLTKAIAKTFVMTEEFEEKKKFGDKILMKHMDEFAEVKISDLINEELRKNDIIKQKLK